MKFLFNFVLSVFISCYVGPQHPVEKEICRQIFCQNEQLLVAAIPSVLIYAATWQIQTSSSIYCQSTLAVIGLFRVVKNLFLSELHQSSIKIANFGHTDG